MRRSRAAPLLAVLFLLFLPHPGARAQEEVLGQNGTLLTAMNEPGARGAECTLGDVTADAARGYAGTDIALIPGGVFRFNLLGGDITREDIDLVFPQNDMLGVGEITAEELWAVLEQSVSAITLNEKDRIDWDRSLSDGFLQVSGLTFRFDASNPPGERVLEAALADGTALSPDDGTTAVTVVSTEAFFTGELAYPEREWTPLECGLADMFAQYTAALEDPLEAPAQDRIRRVGTQDSAFLSDVGSSVFLFLACAGVIALTGALTFGRSIAWKALKDRAMPETEEEKESTLNRLWKK